VKDLVRSLPGNINVANGDGEATFVLESDSAKADVNARVESVLSHNPKLAGHRRVIRRVTATRLNLMKPYEQSRRHPSKLRPSRCSIWVHGSMAATRCASRVSGAKSFAWCALGAGRNIAKLADQNLWASTPLWFQFKPRTHCAH